MGAQGICGLCFCFSVAVGPAYILPQNPIMSLIQALSGLAPRTAALRLTTITKVRSPIRNQSEVLLQAPRHRNFGHAPPTEPSQKPPFPSTNPSVNDPSQPSFNLFAQIKKLPRPARYTLYTGFALLAAGETTFWSNLIYAKWFAKGEQKEKADLLLERFGEAVRGYRIRWMKNYGDYWGAGIWGL
jgi:hypothetical protein